jgi:ABC-type methionine transport system ATPase subunit
VLFDALELELHTGDSVGIWGGPRSGKSALLRLAAGIELADAGTVRFQGRDYAQLANWERASLLRSSIGFAPTPDERMPIGLDRSADVLSFVAAPLVSDGWSELEVGDRSLAALARVEAADCAERAPSELSAGQRTRVGLARALVRQPALLLVDEPALTTSAGERSAIRGLLDSLADERSLAMIVVSTDAHMLSGLGRSYTAGGQRLHCSVRPGSIVALPFRSDTDGAPTS